MSRFPKRPRLEGNDLPANNNNNNNRQENVDHGTDNEFELLTREDARGLIADSMARFHQSNSESAAAVVPNVIPIQPGEIEILPQDIIENNFFLQGFSEQESPLPYSQESVASNASLASTQSLNEDARSLPSFSSNYGMNLDSPAGSQPQSNAASLPIQYPNSQSSVSSQDNEHEVPASSSFLDRIQNTCVEPGALHALLQNIRNGTWPDNNNYE